MLFSELGGRFGTNPFVAMRRMQSDMQRMLSGLTLAPMPVPEVTDYPAITIWLAEDRAVVTAEIPGYGPDDIDLTVRHDTLTLATRADAAQAPETETAEGTVWLRRECHRGTFSRTVRLPFRVDPEGVDARFENGVLYVTLHRPAAERPRKIDIRAA